MRIFFGILLAFFLSGCSTVTAITHCCRSTDHFIVHSDDDRVLYEPGGKAFADVVVAAMPDAVERIERAQYLPFAEPDKVRVYVCATREGFRDLTGRDVRAIVMHKLFLSPRLMETPERVPAYLAHELSHLHLKGHMEWYDFYTLPFWFFEGLATFASGGGGAQRVSRSEAVAAIKDGRHFLPNEKGSFLFSKGPSRWGLKHHMFYHQAMLFMEYLKDVDESSYRKFLLSIKDGSNVGDACKSSYGKDLMAMWHSFVSTL